MLPKRKVLWVTRGLQPRPVPWQVGDRRVSHRCAIPTCHCQPGPDPRWGWAVTARHGALTTEDLSFFAVLWAVPCTTARKGELSRRRGVFLLPGVEYVSSPGSSREGV